mmetsp:Transcript_10925/g.24038  ORF Transcript_10925/g.24038 Transcript_10925/m.24038 type:complete len:202 (+) Transcript_10925:1405-2010(+)
MFSIATCSTTFLIIMGDGFGHRIMHDVAYIWFVYAHTKSNCGAKHTNDSGGPLMMSIVSLIRIQFRMVVGDPHTFTSTYLPQFFHEFVTNFFTVLPAKTVDDPAVVLVFGNVGSHGVDTFFIFLNNAVAEVGSIERRLVSEFITHFDCTTGRVDHLLVGGGREGHDGNIGIVCSQSTQLHVIWSKIMTPIAKTVRFIDNKP